MLGGCDAGTDPWHGELARSMNTIPSMFAMLCVPHVHTEYTTCLYYTRHFLSGTVLSTEHGYSSAEHLVPFTHRNLVLYVELGLIRDSLYRF